MTRTSSLLFVLLAAPLSAQDVPLELWVSPTWPAGLPVGFTNGVSWGDYDADGWPDFFSARSGRLWHNLGGKDWEEAPRLITPGFRYGSSFGDYDNDGLPDIATEPRNQTGEKMLLLNNQGGGVFIEVGGDPNIVDVPPVGDSETIAWVDVDFDGDLDCFVPVYPPWAMGGGLGNYFLRNDGPTGPGGAYKFTELSAEAGLDNPIGSERPEGAQFADVDGDGDPDLLSNNTLYINRSKFGKPRFVALTQAESGIPSPSTYDEGLAFRDHDLDGDQDVYIAYCGGTGVRILENRGDGTFKPAPLGTVENHLNGLCLGLSVADWDNDGDWDFTTRNIFRKNMLMETGQRGFLIATHNIPNAHIGSATPAWADWDRDGDLDCSLGNWTSMGHFYENTLYDANTPDSERRYVRVRVMRGALGIARGLETEYGACVEVIVAGDPRGNYRWRQVVTSSAGYLNQDEYVLHFALPDDPFPGDPEQDLVFDVAVDFVSNPGQGLRRVDKYVNPELGSIELASLDDREIVVFRGGGVTKEGCTFKPLPAHAKDLTTTTSGLIRPELGLPLPDPLDAPSSDWYVGHAFDTALASGPLRLKEVILDGRLDKDVAACVGEQRLALWDVTDPVVPVLAASAGSRRFVRNDRNHYPVDMLLEPGKQYRLVACVDRLRATPVAAPVLDGPVTSQGGLSFVDATPCEGTEVVGAAVDASQVYLALRFAESGGPLWVDLGHALAGAGGSASLRGSGAIVPGNNLSLALTNAPANTATLLVTGESALCRPVSGGLLVPAMDVLTPIGTDGQGEWVHSAALPPGLPPGSTWYFQAWWIDAGAPKGRASSNALSATTPY